MRVRQSPPRQKPEMPREKGKVALRNQRPRISILKYHQDGLTGFRWSVAFVDTVRVRRLDG